MKKVIGWAVEHVLAKTNEVDTRYTRATESEADELLVAMTENDLFPKAGSWRKVKVYA